MTTAHRYREQLQDEVDSAALYRAMAEGERQPELAELYRRLADVEERHARFWHRQLAQAGQAVPPPRPTWRAHTLAWVARRFGARVVVPTVAAKEAADRHVYDRQTETAGTGMAGQERSHARLLGLLSRSAPNGVEGGALARFEGRHRAIGGNALRAAVLGANDGLVSNLSLVMGVAGAGLSRAAVLVAGLAGLLAGAFSMALGEWVSVRSSRELYERQVGIEAGEIAEIPEEETEELTLIYQAKGVPPDQARRLAEQIMGDPDAALETMAREELGVDPEELGGSPWTAAATSFVLFAVGAVIPVAPFLAAQGGAAVVASLVAAGLGLFAIGAAITLFTGRSVWASGGRQLAVGLGAAAVTYTVGWAIGVNVTT